MTAQKLRQLFARVIQRRLRPCSQSMRAGRIANELLARLEPGLSRHRQHLAEGLDPRESAARAVATAGGSVLFAGTTVVIALVGLVVVGIPFLSVMGVASAATIAIAVLIALTLGPAVFGFAGPRLHRGKNIPPDRSAGRRWG